MKRSSGRPDSPKESKRPKSRSAHGEAWIKTRWSGALSGRPSRDTAPELALRRELHRLGFRFRVHTRIAGTRLSVDIMLPRWRAAVFVHGCHWHQHGCEIGGKLTAGPNRAIWIAKFDAVRDRERRAATALGTQGIRSFVVWECEIRENASEAAAKIRKILQKE